MGWGGLLVDEFKISPTAKCPCSIKNDALHITDTLLIIVQSLTGTQAERHSLTEVGDWPCWHVGCPSVPCSWTAAGSPWVGSRARGPSRRRRGNAGPTRCPAAAPLQAVQDGTRDMEVALAAPEEQKKNAMLFRKKSCTLNSTKGQCLPEKATALSRLVQRG